MSCKVCLMGTLPCRSYNLKSFRSDLKDVLRRVGVERQPCLLLLEDHQLVSAEMLEAINSLLSGGEVSGDRHVHGAIQGPATGVMFAVVIVLFSFWLQH